MSRRRRGVDRTFATLHIVCGCGARLGRVAKMRGSVHPYVVFPPLELRQATAPSVPEPTPTGGKIARKCPECGAEFQRTWPKVQAALDDLEARGGLSADIT